MGVPQSRPDSRPQSPCAPRCASCGRLAERVSPWCSLGLNSNADRGVEKTSATACCESGREESRWSSNGTPKQGGKGCARSWVLVLVIKPVRVKERGWVHWGRAERLRPFPGSKHAVKRKKQKSKDQTRNAQPSRGMS